MPFRAVTTALRTSLLIIALCSVMQVQTATSNPANGPSPPPPESKPYKLLWAIASRTAMDPAGNSSAPGACRRLVGPPLPESYRRTQCKAELLQSWVPTIKTPRYVDVRFEVKATILATAVVGFDIQVLNLGTLKPPIKSVDLVLSVPGREGSLAVTAFNSRSVDKLSCPGVTFIPLARKALAPVDGQPLTDARVLGLRIHVPNTAVTRRAQLPSIAAVGMRVRES